MAKEQISATIDKGVVRRVRKAAGPDRRNFSNAVEKLLTEALDARDTRVSEARNEAAIQAAQ